MDKDNKRAKRRKDEQTIWLRRLNCEFNKHYLENPEEVKIAEDLKNYKYGKLLKNTTNPYKNVAKHLENKHEQKIERREGKKIINEELLSYNTITDNKNRIEDCRNKLKTINEQIDLIEQLLIELPEHLQELLQEKREIETDICYLQR